MASNNSARRPQELSLSTPVLKTRRSVISPVQDINANDKIELPVRYQKQQQKQQQGCNGDIVTDNYTERTKDLDVALKWLRQEIMYLKEQDRDLMQQLLTLRAVMHKMRGVQSCPSLISSKSMSLDHAVFSSLSVPIYHSSCPKPTTPDDPTGRDIISEPCMEKAPTWNQILLEFQSRTVSLNNIRQDDLRLANPANIDPFF